MKIIQFLLISLLLLTSPHLLHAADIAKIEEEKIEALITSIENLRDATFVRNGDEYDAKTAARFLRRKWQSKGDEIKTSTDFIGKIASASGTSGKAYLIRFKDGREAKCGDYLHEELKKLGTEEAEKQK
jgi:hypothetical protein